MDYMGKDIFDISKIEKINKNIVDEDGNILSFEKQILKFVSNKFDISKPFVIMPNSESIGYINDVDSTYPLIIKYRTLKHIERRHPNDYDYISSIKQMIDGNVMSLDSKKFNDSKIIVTDRINGKSPTVIICRLDNKFMNIDVNEINTMYQKNKFEELLAQTYNRGENIYCNKKTEAFINSEEGFQLPTELIDLLYSNNYRGTINKSQSLLYKENVLEFKNEQNSFEYRGGNYIPIHSFREHENNLHFISSLYSQNDYLEIDYNEFYEKGESKADIFFSFETGNCYIPTIEKLYLIPKEKLKHLDLSNNAYYILDKFKQEYQNTRKYYEKMKEKNFIEHSHKVNTRRLSF